MAFAVIKDGILDHEKFEALMADATLKPVERMAAGFLWAKASAWCARRYTDGAIPADVVWRLAGVPRRTAERFALALVNARGGHEHGLWELRPGGYQVHDYTEHNYSKERIEQKRESGRRGGRKSAQARAQAPALPPVKQVLKQPLKQETKQPLKQTSSSSSSHPEVSESNPLYPPEGAQAPAQAPAQAERLCEHGNPIASCLICAASKDEAMKTIAKLGIQPSEGGSDMRTARPKRIGA